MTTTGDIAPVMVGVSPLVMAQRRQRVNAKPSAKKKKTSRVESILGENVTLIPDDAEPFQVSTDGQSTDGQSSRKDGGEESNLIPPPGGEPLLQTALALVAPDTTPNAEAELDPALVPNRDVALSAILGEKPTTFKQPPQAPPPPSTTPPSSEASSEVAGLPESDMPRPPGDFLKPMSFYVGESGPDGQTKSDRKVELVTGSSSSIVGSAMPVAEGQLGAVEMPKPVDGNTRRTMEVFRRFGKI